MIAWKRSQNDDVSRYFARRAKLCFVLGSVEKSHDGLFQLAFSQRIAIAACWRRYRESP
jgi:hypothetical protein